MENHIVIVKNREHAPVKDSFQEHFKSIDGLRGVACLVVVIFHCYSLAGQYKWPSVQFFTLHLSLSSILDLGYSGVDMFFVLSGFCLAYPLFLRHGSSFNWKRYLISRARRIFPPYWSALLIFSSLSLIIKYYRIEPFFSAGPLIWAEDSRSFIKAVFLVNCDLLWSYWTLPLEWRWYFVLPILVSLYKRIHAVGVMTVTIFISFSCVVAFSLPQFHRIAGYVTQMPLYLPTFACGIWAAAIAANFNKLKTEIWLIKHIRLAILVVVFLGYVFPPQYSAPFSRVIIWAPLYFLILLAALYDPVVRKFFSWQPFTKVGIFSYSLYLIHEFPIRAVYTLTKQLEWPPEVQFFFYQCLVCPTCIGLGYLFFCIGERPFLKQPLKAKEVASG
jgi:peptidoglycan/LPS O-acetylase OafA/YrhL